jgi:hypothetical protein
MAFIFNNGIRGTLDYNPNDATLSNALAYYHLKELLKTAGWTHEASNDGTNVSNTSGNANDKVDSGTEFNNNQAYWFGSRPAIARGIGAPGNDIIGFRRFTGSTAWGIYYIPANTDGSKQAITVNGTTTTIPQWTTMKAVRGTLPDTAPGTSWMFTSATTRRYSFGADNAAPYGFFFVGHQASGILNTSSGNGGSFILFDHVEPDSMQPGDVTSAVITVANDSSVGPYWSGALNTATPADNAGGPVTYMRYGLTGSVWTQCPMLVLAHDLHPIYPGGAGLSQYSPLAEVGMPVLYGIGASYNGGSSRVSNNNNSGQPCGLKGRSYMLSWRGAGLPFGALLSKLSTGDRCVIGDLVVPWDGSTQVTFTS